MSMGANEQLGWGDRMNECKGNRQGAELQWEAKLVWP
jgi:hypothetical protein